MFGGLLVGLITLSHGNFACVGFGHGAEALASSIGPMTVVNFLYAIVTAQMLFGDLFSSRLSNAIHAFPLRRESWFVTHTAAGLLFSFLPNLIMSVCFLPLMGQMWYISFIWLLAMTLEYLFFFGLAVFSAMSTGNRFAMASIYALINSLPLLLYWFADTFYEPLLYGITIHESNFTRFSPTVWLYERTGFVEFSRKYAQGRCNAYPHALQYFYEGLSGDWLYFAIIAVAGVVLLGVGLLMYRRRKLESAGDFMVFRWVKPIFSVMFTLGVGALFEMFGTAILNREYVFLGIGIAVGYFVGQMMLQRKVWVFRIRSFAACGAIGGLLALSIFLTDMDPLDIDRRAPYPDIVTEVTFRDGWFTRDAKLRTITNPEVIKELVAIHQQILYEGEVETRPSSGNYVEIDYTVSGGWRDQRSYYYASDEVYEMVAEFCRNPEIVFDVKDWDKLVEGEKTVKLNGEVLSDADAKALLLAVEKDCMAGTMMRNLYGDSSSATLDKIWVQTEDYYFDIDLSGNSDSTLEWISKYKDAA